MATDFTPTVVPPLTPVMAPMTVSHGEKPEKFNVTDFKRWQQKMLFYLTTLNLTRFLRVSHPHPLLAAGVPATPQKSPAVNSND